MTQYRSFHNMDADTDIDNLVDMNCLCIIISMHFSCISFGFHNYFHALFLYHFYINQLRFHIPVSSSNSINMVLFENLNINQFFFCCISCTIFSHAHVPEYKQVPIVPSFEIQMVGLRACLFRRKRS